MAALVLRDIKKTYTAADGAARQVLAGIDLTVDAGEFAVLVGPSGCGKTTLLKIIAGLVKPDATQFSLTIDGKPITSPGPDRGVVFQQYHSYPWLTVLENVKFGLQFTRMSERDRVRKAEEQLHVVGLSEYRDEYPSVLSGGQQQRVAIARTLAADPRVILMDEPFAALDAQTREAMQSELLQLQARTKSTIVFVTHDIAEAAFLGNQVYVLSRIPAKITAHVDARTIREKTLRAMSAETLRQGQDGRLDAQRGEWLRYDPEFLQIQKQLKQALDGRPILAPSPAPIVDRETLADRDAELAGAVTSIVRDVQALDQMPSAEVSALACYCLGRIRLLRMGGRSAPLVALAVIVWRRASDVRLDSEEALNLALGVAVDPSYIWPEWGIVLAGAILAQYGSLQKTDQVRTENGWQEIVRQAELRLVHLESGERPAPTDGVRRTAEALLVALRSHFPLGIRPVVEAASQEWPSVAGPINADELRTRVAELDRSMPAWYSNEDRAMYRRSLEERDAWLIPYAQLALAAQLPAGSNTTLIAGVKLK